MNLFSKSLLAFGFFSAVGFASFSQSAKHWNIDKTHASVIFGIDHFISEVT